MVQNEFTLKHSNIIVNVTDKMSFGSCKNRALFLVGHRNRKYVSYTIVFLNHFLIVSVSLSTIAVIVL